MVFKLYFFLFILIIYNQINKDFIKPLKKKGHKELKENIIYQHSEDIIENYTNENYQKRNKTIKK